MLGLKLDHVSKRGHWYVDKDLVESHDNVKALEMFSTLLAVCKGESLVISGFPSQMANG